MRVDAVVTQYLQCVVYIEDQIAVMFIAAPPAVAYAPEDDQAMIAIDNARLFKELEARTTDLTRSVGELKAL